MKPFALMIVLTSVAFAQHQHQEGMQHSTTQDSTSPYVELVSSPIAGLSQAEIDDLLAGRGMGFALTAELSSYPGPTHLLELQNELALSPAQLQQITRIKTAMQAQAQALGQEIVSLERELSDAFRTKTINQSDLGSKTAALAELYGDLRAVHLQAHVDVTPLLSEAQILHYDQLRGYR